MVTQVQLGNFFTSGGRTILGGVGGSGLDTEGLIKSLTEAKRFPAIKLEDQVKLNAKRATALADFQKLVSKFKDSLNFLRNPPGVANAADNAFRYTNASATSNTAVAASAYISVASAPGASPQTYAITEITSVARAKKQTTGTFTIANADTAVVATTPAAGQFKAGQFKLKGHSITFDNGDTLNTVAAKINAVSGETHIGASVIKVGDNSYQLSLSATQTGTEADFDFNNIDVADTLIDDSDVFDLVSISTVEIDSVLQTAANATFNFNGVTITRQSNTVTDIVDGLTINILQTTPASTRLDVTVKADESIAKNAIINFVNAYNDLKLFAAKQTEVKADGSFAEDAVLGNSNALRTTMSTIASQLSGIVGGITGGAFDRLGDLGIASADFPESPDNPLVRNILNVDDGKLTAALASNFEQVRRVFEFDFVSSNPNLRVFSRTNDLNISNFTLTVNPYAVQTTNVINVADTETPLVVASDPTSDQLKAGVITINGHSIAIDAGLSLKVIAQRFADAAPDTGVTAEVVEVGTGKFQIKFTSTVINGATSDLKSASVDPDGVFANRGITQTPSFKATYTTTGGPVTVDVDGSYVFDSQGNRTGVSLKGKAGTALAGLVMVYGGIAPSISTVTITQGIADKLFNTTDGVITPDSGIIDLETSALDTSDTRLDEQIKRIDEQVERFRQQLLEKFGALEQVISRVNNLLQAIDAQNQLRNNS